eukprot:scaffold13251_cov78-Cyclotella_meneghiniana.AAC.4
MENTKTNQQEGNIDVDANNANDGLFHLTENITIPKMTHIVNEILLLQKPGGVNSNNHENNQQNNNDYQYNDAHSSNAHRYYLLNGLASGGGAGQSDADNKVQAVMNTTLSLSRSSRTSGTTTSSPRQLSLANHGGPLTLYEIVSAGITSLGARTRIEAERDMVFHNPLFQQFVMAVGSKGFFADKGTSKNKDDKSTRKDSSNNNENNNEDGGGSSIARAFLTPEEESRRAKVVYEEKYRKVVNKFRSKLAVKAEANPPQSQPMSPQFRQQQQQQGSMGVFSNSPYPMQQHLQPVYTQQYPYGYPQSTTPRSNNRMPQQLLSPTAGNSYNWNNHASPRIMNSVADRQRQQREMKIQQVRAGGRDGYALNQERGRMQQHEQQRNNNYQQQNHIQQSTEQNQQNQSQQQSTSQYQPLHQVQLQQSNITRSNNSQRPPTTPNRAMQQQQKPTQSASQQTPSLSVQTQQQYPGQYETPKSQKHWPADSTKSTTSQFNFDSHTSPFEKPPLSTRSKPPTPPRSARSSTSPQTTQVIPEPQPTPRLHEPDLQQHNENNTDFDQHEAEQLNAEGNAFMQQKLFQEAINSYTAAIDTCPTGPNSHVYYSNRSAAHLSLNDHARSIADSESSLELCPDYAKAHSRLGLAYFVSGQYDKAVKAYEVALEYEPENEWNRSHYEKALKKLSKSQRKSLQEIPFGEDDNMHMQSDSNMDNHSCEGDNRDQVREADLYKDAGNAHMSNKQYEDALEQYTHAIALSPHGPSSHVYYSNRAAAYCYLGQYAAAADDCLTSIEINPEYEKAHARLGLSRFFLEDFEGAVEAYGRALELEPSNTASRSYLEKAKKRLEDMMLAESNTQQDDSQNAMRELIMQEHNSDVDGSLT